MNWEDVEAKLRERVEAVVRHLLPKGKRVGGEWLVGSVVGEEGCSMKVNLVGKVGTWRDFAAEKGGKNLIELWKQVRRLDFKPAIIEAENFLGIRDDYHKRVKSYREVEAPGSARPEVDESSWKAVAEVWAKCQPLTVDGPVWNYLVGERKLEGVTLDWFDVREMVSNGQWVIVYPYFLPPDTTPAGQALVSMQPHLDAPAWLKFEALERKEGKKREWTTKGPQKCLWGLRNSTHAAFKKCDHVLICEGEKDALSWASYDCARWGLLPVSVPFGAKWRGQVPGQPSPNREWLDRCWAWLDQFESVFVAMDGDEPGQRAAADIIYEIGPRRCRLVELPIKPQLEV
jgi:twinkle protein